MTLPVIYSTLLYISNYILHDLTEIYVQFIRIPDFQKQVFQIEMLFKILVVIAVITNISESVPDSIVGGEEVQNGRAYPWMASLIHRDKHYCGGSLIHPEWIVTAAHCITDKKPDEIVLASLDISEMNYGIRRHVKIIIVHNKYNATMRYHDIAMVQLSDPVFEIPPIKMLGRDAREGDMMEVLGWGLYSPSSGISKKLRHVYLPLVSNAYCARSYRDKITDDHVCCGYAEGKKDSCQGDSGGPLFMNIDGSSQLVALVSYGEGCALPDKYGVYTSVHRHMKWIRGVIPYESPLQRRSKERLWCSKQIISTCSNPCAWKRDTCIPISGVMIH